MTELIDWDEFEPMPVGTPGWWEVAAKLSGHTRRPASRVFVAVEHDLEEGGPCRVLVAADIPEFGPEVLTPYVLDIRVSREGVDTFLIVGASMQREVRVLTP